MVGRLDTCYSLGNPMRDLIELGVLLFLMTLGYNVVRGSRRVMHETLAGLLLWAGILGAVAALMLMPSVLVTLAIAATGAMLAYGAVWLVLWFIRTLRPVPYLPVPRRHRLLALLKQAGYSRRSAKTALIGLWSTWPDNAGPPRILAAAATVEACLAQPAEENLSGFLREEAARLAEAADFLRQGIAEASACAHSADRELAQGILLRLGFEGAKRALRVALVEGRGTQFRRRLVKAVSQEKVPHQRAQALRHLGIEVACEPPTGTSVWQRLGPHRAVPAAVFPMYAYATLGCGRRALLFTICYGLTATYGVHQLHQHRPAGWVFLAVAAMLHLSALFNLDLTCGTVATPGSGEGGGRARATARHEAAAENLIRRPNR